MKYTLVFLGILCLVAVASFVNGGVYNLHAGNVAYPEGFKPVYKICNGLTIVVGDPIAHHYDLPVNGICFGSIVDRPELTSEQKKKINGPQVFYMISSNELDDHDYRCKTDPLYDPADPCEYSFEGVQVDI
jgi:hypothetical protein